MKLQLCFSIFGIFSLIALGQTSAQDRLEVGGKYDKTLRWEMQGENKKKLCVPNILQGGLRTISSFGNLTSEATVTIGFHYPKNKIGMRAFVKNPNQPPVNVRIVVLLDKNVTYYINPKNKTCTKVPYAKFYFLQCMPQNAIKLKSEKLGGLLKTDLYQIRNQFLVSNHSITPLKGNKFYPVVETYKYPQGVIGGLTVVTYYDWVPKIKDKTIFDIPEYCPPVSGEPNDEMVKLFSNLFLTI